MQKLSLTKRPGKIGGNIPTNTTKTERDGRQEVVPATAIPVHSIPLTPEEFGHIMGDEGSYDALVTKERSQFAEPRWRDVPYIPFKGKFKGAKVTLQVRGTKFILKPATVDNIKFVVSGDQVGLSATVRGVEPEEGLRVGSLLNQPCDISIQGGTMDDNEEQGKLALEGGGPAESEKDTDPDTLADAEAEEEEATRRATGSPDIDETIETMSRTGRKIGRAAAKKKRK